MEKGFMRSETKNLGARRTVQDVKPRVGQGGKAGLTYTVTD